MTLTELLLAIVLLLAMAALVWPPLRDGLDARTFESACDAAEQQLLLARAHAQSKGEAIEIAYVADPPCLEARQSRPGESADDHVGDVAAAEGAVAHGWATCSLPRGVVVSMQPSPALPEPLWRVAMNDAGKPPARGVDPRTVEEPPAEPARLVVYLPDGTAALAREFWLVDDGGRRARFSINPWTGVPRVETQGAAEVSSEPADSLDEMDQPMAEVNDLPEESAAPEEEGDDAAQEEADEMQEEKDTDGVHDSTNEEGGA
jgi:hypothetical protein